MASTTEPDHDELISVPEACRRLGISPAAAYRLVIEQNELPYLRFDKWPFIRVPASAVTDYCERQKRSST